jgi:hypothetical protein
MNTKDFFRKSHSFQQYSTHLVVIALLLAFLLGACGTAAQPASDGSIINEVQTAVAETNTARATSSSSPTATYSPTPTPTPISTILTLPTVTPTPTYHVLYWTYTSYEDCYDSDLVKNMTIPDGTVFAPRTTFVKTWKFKNIGDCTWDDDFYLIFVGGNDMSGSDSEIDTTVSPNRRLEISVTLVAPSTAGTYYGYWQLADDDGNIFGETGYVEIVVAKTATKTPTPTSTQTSTPTQTLTPTPTSTYVSTDTPTSTPASTDVYTPTPTPTPTGALDSTSTPTPTLSPTQEPTSTDTPDPTEVPTEEPVESVIALISCGFF